MINPNKSYKANVLATVISVDPLDSYIPYVRIKTDCGRVYEGDLLRAYSRPELIKTGDRVSFEGRFSIVSDKFLISKIVRKREAA